MRCPNPSIFCATIVRLSPVWIRGLVPSEIIPLHRKRDGKGKLRRATENKEVRGTSDLVIKTPL